VDGQDIATQDNSYKGVRCVVTEAGSKTAQVGAIIAILSRPRYAQDNLPTAIA